MWETLLTYSRQSPRWLEPVSRYQPQPELLEVYRAIVPPDWRLHRRSFWFHSAPPASELVEQGWKIHVSTTPDQAAEALRRALPVLVEHEVRFKFLLDRHCVVETSAKRWGRGGAGKFIAIYPTDDVQFKSIATELRDALAGLDGPYILSDRRVPGARTVFYRYGGFVAMPQLMPDGTSAMTIHDDTGAVRPDVRNPFYFKPSWVSDPFGEEDPGDEVPRLAEGRFSITEALSYSNAGGVYRATDHRTGQEVVLKEARPGVLVGRNELDAQAALRKEYEILQALSGSGHFAQPVALFTEWEHLFMAEEFIDGQQMSQRSIKSNPVIRSALGRAELVEYYTAQQRWWLALADALAYAHERDIVIADLSFTNVLVRAEDDQLVLIDLESAIRLGVDTPVGLHTPGVSHPDALRTGQVDIASDYYSLGALILGSIMYVNGAIGYHLPLLDGFLEELSADLRLPAELPALVRSLMTAPGQVRPAALRARLAVIDFARHPDWAEPVPLSRPASAASGLTPAELTALIAGSRDQIVATADLGRSDRLFPGDVMTFETNPYSVGYGAAGVLHALQHSGGIPDPRLIAWLLQANLIQPGICPPGLYTGTAGIAWVLDELGATEAARACMRAAVGHPLRTAEAGLLAGTAGIGLACLRLGLRAGDSDFAAEALGWARECAAELESAAQHGENGVHWLRHNPFNGPARPVPIGYAHGGSGIALFLLCLARVTGEDKWRQLGRVALRHDLSYAHELNPGHWAFPAAAPAPGGTPRVVRNYWDEGTAGIATTLIRYLADADGHDPELADAWRQVRPDLCRKYAVLPQLYHGLSGIGMALLDAAELLGDATAANEAGRLAVGVSKYAIPVAEGIAFPGEQCLREGSDLATGGAGVLMFLNRCAQYGDSPYTNHNFVLDDLIGLPRLTAGRPAGPTRC